MEPRTITTQQLKNKLSSGEKFEFWNVLTDEYFAGEIIPGSRRVPLDRLDQETIRVAKDTEIVVYCSGMPKCLQSKSAAERLSAAGFITVLDYSGGTGEWKSLGGKTEKLQTKVVSD